MRITVANAAPAKKYISQLVPGDKFRFRRANNVNSDLHLYLGKAEGFIMTLCLTDSTFELSPAADGAITYEGRVNNLEISLS